MREMKRLGRSPTVHEVCRARPALTRSALLGDGDALDELTNAILLAWHAAGNQVADDDRFLWNLADSALRRYLDQLTAIDLLGWLAP